MRLSLRTKKLYANNQGFNFLTCNFGHVWTQIQFRSERQPSILRDDFNQGQTHPFLCWVCLTSLWNWRLKVNYWNKLEFSSININKVLLASTNQVLKVRLKFRNQQLLPQIRNPITFQTLCVIWNHLCNLKNMKNTHGTVLLLQKFHIETCNSTKHHI